MSNPVSDMMSEAVKSIKGLIDVNTVIGDPITAPDGTMLIPVSKVSFGFGGGGSEFDSKNSTPKFGGGMGGGAKVEAEAFMVISNGNVRIVPVHGSQTPVDKIIDMVPTAVDKINGLYNKNKKSDTENQEFGDI